MDWLNLDLPSETQFRMEQQRRELRSCNDPIVLRAVGEALIQEAHHLGSVVSQLMKQVATLELELAKAGSFAEPSAEHYRWAQELRQDLIGQADS